MNKIAILWNLETEQQQFQINKHQGEIVNISFNSDGDKIITGSFDFTVKVWDSYNGEEICSLDEHTQELRACSLIMREHM